MTTPIRFAGVIVGAAGIALAAAAPAAAAPAAPTSPTKAKLSVLHAVPDLPVDVYVNGKRTLDDFQPGDLAGPLELAPGTYSVAITAADAKDDSDPAIGPVDLPLKAGQNATAVAHLDADGKPTATLFDNDVTPAGAGNGRLTVRHTAAAPAVDVLAGGKAVIKGLENPDEKVLNLPAGTISASVAAAGKTDALIGPADVDVAEGVNTIVYAWGSLEDDNLDIAVQTIDGLHGDPSGVNSGTGGFAAEGPNLQAGWIAAGVLGLLLAAGGSVAVARARRS